MKLFFGILLTMAVIGGFAGAEIIDTSFSILGAAIGGIGTGAILLGLGAYFDSQDRKSSELTPEMRGVFDRMITGKSNPTRKEIENAKRLHRQAFSHTPARKQSSQRPDLSLEGTIKSLMAQDAEAIARGEVPERRLIPHHAIKRDVIIAGYTKDFCAAQEQVQKLSWSSDKKTRQLEEMQQDFDKKINGIKQLPWEELDKIITLMKKTRTDFEELEQGIRAEKSIYKIVEPL